LVTTGGGLRLDAQREGSILSIAASGSGSSGTAGFNLAGSVAYDVIRNTTSTYLSGAVVNFNGAAMQPWPAEDTSDIFSIGGAATLGGKGGFGAGVTVNTIDNTTAAYLSDSRLNTTGSLTLSGKNDNDINSISASIGASEALSISGAASANIIHNKAQAYVDNSNAGNKAIGSGGRPDARGDR
jgi:hypothetical protein